MGVKRRKELTTMPSPAALDVLLERQRQVDEEGWSPEHDDRHDAGELAAAGACYAVNAACLLSPLNGTGIEDITQSPIDWPFSVMWWKPGTPRRDLVKAAALLIAEIERLDRWATTQEPNPAYDPNMDMEAERAAIETMPDREGNAYREPDES